MIRKGMWCVSSDGKVGIANALDGLGGVEFHLVDAEGVTTMVVQLRAEELVQARLREIPKSRRNLTKGQFAALGYV